MLDEIALFLFGRAFARGHADDALAAAALRAKRAHRGAFDEAAVRDADDAAFVGDQILHVDLALVRARSASAAAPRACRECRAAPS